MSGILVSSILILSTRPDGPDYGTTGHGTQLNWYSTYSGPWEVSRKKCSIAKHTSLMRSGLCCSTNSYILQAENRRLPGITSGNGKEMIVLVKSVHWWALPNVLHLSEEGAVEIFNRGGAGEWVGFTQMITPHLLTGTLPPPPLNNIRS